MLNIKELGVAVQQIAVEKGIPAERVFAAIETSIAAAYKKEFRKKTEMVRCRMDVKTGDLKFWQVKLVVDPEGVRIVEENPEEEEAKRIAEEQFKRSTRYERETEEIEEGETLPRYNPDRHIFTEEARLIKPDAEPGEELEFPLETHSDFGRIAAQTAKQVVLQSIRDAERASVFEEYAAKIGEIVSGAVQRFDRGNVFVDLGRAVGVMLRAEAIPGERYRVGDRMRFYLMTVQQETRQAGILLSRANPQFLAKLFELEVPEIADGIVEVKSVAREAGARSKIAVASNEEGVDPVGSAVGQRGTRVMAVTNELGNEKVDIIEWSADPAAFIANAISPAKALSVNTNLKEPNAARVIVADDQLSLAIGKGGQNVRLAAKLTGWKIDVRAESNPEEAQAGGVAVSGENAEETAAPTEEAAPEPAPAPKTEGRAKQRLKKGNFADK